MSREIQDGAEQVFDELAKIRARLIDALGSAIVLAIGVGLITSLMTDALKADRGWLWTLAVALTIIPVCFVSYRLAKLPSRRVQIVAFLPIDRTTNGIIEIDRYSFGDDVHRWMRGLFAENPAQRTLWKDSRKNELFVLDESKQPAWGKMVQEAAEYFMLKHLGFALNGHFRRDIANDKWIVEIGREQMPDVVLRNRFVDLFSRPIQERTSFSELHKDRPGIGEISLASGPRGEIFDRVEFTLPRNCKLQRSDQGGIVVNTPEFSLELDADLPFFNTSLPDQFERLYLGYTDPIGCDCRQLELRVTLTFKFRSIFTVRRRLVYGWVDTLMKGLSENASKDMFFKRIGWEVALTTDTLIRKRTALTTQTTKGKGETAAAPRT